MKCKPQPIRLMALLALAVILAPAQAADPELSRNLAATCTNCHGPGGNPVQDSGMDPLTGMKKELFLRKLKEFKSGTRSATIMHQIAKGYTDDQLERIAEYYAARP